jgi:hypothetical protein
MAEHLGSRITAAVVVGEESDIKLSYDIEQVMDRIRQTVDKKLKKKNIDVHWSDQDGDVAVLIRLIRVDEGKQFMRWLIPFSAPAVVIADVDVSIRGAGGGDDFDSINADGRAHFGFFGGSPTQMVGVSADRVATQIAKAMIQSLG